MRYLVVTIDKGAQKKVARFASCWDARDWGIREATVHELVKVLDTQLKNTFWSSQHEESVKEDDAGNRF